MRTITGDLIALGQAGHFDVIVHGCNCHCTMGAGIAKQIRAAFPAAWEADRRTTAGDRTKLGSCTFATIAQRTGDLTVVNAYTQFHWSGPGPKVDYDAVTSCMRWLRRFTSQRIGMPLIGAGLAGGDWSAIAAIIERELPDANLAVVRFDPTGSANR